MRLLLACLILLTSLTATGLAHAVPAADATLAKALFQSGKDAMARGDLPTACGRFAESLKLDPAVGTLLNLATCEEKSGKLVIALEHFTAARTELAADDFRVAFTTERIANLTQRVARIVIRMPPPPATTTATTTMTTTRVSKDGVEIDQAALAAPITVDPGKHVILVEMTGERPQRTELTLRDGEEKVVEVRPPRGAGQSNDAAVGGGGNDTRNDDNGGAAKESSASTRRTLAFVSAGIGVAGIATGAIAGLMTINAASTYRTHCKEGICDPDGLDAAETGRVVRIVSPVGFIVGGVFGAASVYLFLTAPKKKSSSGSVQLTPTATPFGGGLSLAGTF